MRQAVHTAIAAAIANVLHPIGTIPSLSQSIRKHKGNNERQVRFVPSRFFAPPCMNNRQQQKPCRSGHATPMGDARFLSQASHCGICFASSGAAMPRRYSCRAGGPSDIAQIHSGTFDRLNEWRLSDARGADLPSLNCGTRGQNSSPTFQHLSHQVYIGVRRGGPGLGPPPPARPLRGASAAGQVAQRAPGLPGAAARLWRSWIGESRIPSVSLAYCLTKKEAATAAPSPRRYCRALRLISAAG